MFPELTHTLAATLREEKPATLLVALLTTPEYITGTCTADNTCTEDSILLRTIKGLAAKFQPGAEFQFVWMNSIWVFFFFFFFFLLINRVGTLT